MPLVPWLRAALVGPCISLTFLVTTLTLMGRVGEGQSRLMLWLESMAFAGVLAILSASALLLVDWTFFKANLRKLPTGRRAWMVSAAMPVGCAAVYQALSPGDDFGAVWFASLIVPALVIAALLRWTFSEALASD
jgi:hypothetical protein